MSGDRRKEAIDRLQKLGNIYGSRSVVNAATGEPSEKITEGDVVVIRKIGSILDPQEFYTSLGLRAKNAPRPSEFVGPRQGQQTLGGGLPEVSGDDGGGDSGDDGPEATDRQQASFGPPGRLDEFYAGGVTPSGPGVFDGLYAGYEFAPEFGGEDEAWFIGPLTADSQANFRYPPMVKIEAWENYDPRADRYVAWFVGAVENGNGWEVVANALDIAPEKAADYGTETVTLRPNSTPRGQVEEQSSPETRHLSVGQSGKPLYAPIGQRPAVRNVIYDGLSDRTEALAKLDEFLSGLSEAAPEEMPEVPNREGTVMYRTIGEETYAKKFGEAALEAEKEHHRLRQELYDRRVNDNERQGDRGVGQIEFDSEAAVADRRASFGGGAAPGATRQPTMEEAGVPEANEPEPVEQDLDEFVDRPSENQMKLADDRETQEQAAQRESRDRQRRSRDRRDESQMSLGDATETRRFDTDSGGRDATEPLSDPDRPNPNFEESGGDLSSFGVGPEDGRTPMPLGPLDGEDASALFEAAQATAPGGLSERELAMAVHQFGAAVNELSRSGDLGPMGVKTANDTLRRHLDAAEERDLITARESTGIVSAYSEIIEADSFGTHKVAVEGFYEAVEDATGVASGL